jgi:hypothetical protein
MAGRPAKYETNEDLVQAIENYWSEIQENNSKATITGLALFLGFESRQSFYKYELDGEFSYTIKKARLRIESIYEQNLHSGNPTGSIFALKNFGWSDKQEIEHNINIPLLPSIVIKTNQKTD